MSETLELDQMIEEFKALVDQGDIAFKEGRADASSPIIEEIRVAIGKLNGMGVRIAEIYPKGTTHADEVESVINTFEEPKG